MFKVVIINFKCCIGIMCFEFFVGNNININV